MSSYERYTSGRNHDLLFILNGFEQRDAATAYHSLFCRVPHQILVLPKPVWDITAYFECARSVTSELICFLNSYSEVLDAQWLAKLCAPFVSPQTGAVAATGSYESIYSSHLQRARFSSRNSRLRRLYDNVRTFAELERNRRRFAPFPAPHLRSNAFVLRTKAVGNLRVPQLRSKMDCYAFESGRDSMTAQMSRRGLDCLVVGRNGEAYRMPDWKRSGTYRSSDQENLLIADNQTRDYASADAERRRALEQLAWAPDALATL